MNNVNTDDHQKRPGLLRRFRTEIIVLLVFILVPCAIFFGLRARGGNVAGFYILAGGEGFASIQRTPTGYKVDTLRYSHFPNTELQVKTWGKEMRIENHVQVWSHTSGSNAFVMYLRPSAHREGDFDLVLLDNEYRGEKWYEKIWVRISSLWTDRATPVAPPLPGFLHRVNDADVESYLQLAGREPSAPLPGHAAAPATSASLFAPSINSTQMLAYARRAHERHPEDLTLRVLLLDALARAGNAAELQQLVQQWKPGFDTAPPHDALAVAMFRQAAKKAGALTAQASGTNAFAELLRAIAPGTSLQECNSAIEQLGHHETLGTPGGITLPTENVMQYLALQLRVKTAGVEMWFRLLNGDVDSAMSLAIGRYRVGQVTSEHDEYVITKLIGIALRSLSANDLAKFAANAPMTPGQSGRLVQELERLSKFEVPVDKENFYESPIAAPLPYGPGVPIPNYEEARYRHLAAAARFQLARTAAATRNAFITKFDAIDWTSSASVAAALPAPMPSDPFSSSGVPIKNAYLATSETVVLYSVGPDAKDDGGAVEYDPTNGTVSSGDITAELRRVPQYPIPAGGVRADTTATLALLLPNGLPPDVFSKPAGSPLIAVDTTGTVTVYSIGPDRESPKAAFQNEPGYPATLYDPTNGLVSVGDLVTTLAR